MKINALKFFFFLLISISFVACKRNEKLVNEPCTGSCITFNIKVGTDLNNTTNVGGASVELGWNRPATPIGDAGRLIATGTTAPDGTLSLSFKAQDKELKAGQFYILIKKGDEYFAYDEGFYGITKADSTINLKAHLPSKATLKLVYKNFSPQISTDYFSCNPYYKKSMSYNAGLWMYGSNGQMSNTSFALSNGAFTTLELSGVTAGNEYTYFNILKKSNGGRIDLKDSVYIAKGDVKTYIVDYK